MTDPEPPALSKDEPTKILVTVSKTQPEGIKTLQADTTKYLSDQLEKFSQVLATSSAKSDSSDRPSKGIPNPDYFTGQLRISTPGLNNSGRQQIYKSGHLRYNSSYYDPI